MTKLLNTLSLLVAVGTLSTLTGCELYFGNHGSNDNWSYCGSDGFYQCQGDSCEWVSSTCPDGTGSGSGGGSGYQCGANTDCAAGCYCTANGVCEEGGFCATNADCGTGYFCDTQRSSCEPNPPGCTTNADCASGQVCNTANATCTAGTCAGDIATSCTTAAPVCPSGSSPLMFNGCYTGFCSVTTACDAAPTCAHINDETNCEGRTDCQATFTGLNCTDMSNGQSCHSGQSGCTCAQFVFAACAAANL